MRFARGEDRGRRAGALLAAAGILLLAMAGAETIDAPDVDLSVLEPAVKGAIDEAIAAFDVALPAATDDAERADAWGRLGMSYQAHHLQDAARICYQQAVALAPGEFRWLYYLGYLHQELGEYDAALFRYGQALAIDPSYLPALVRVGRARLSGQDLPGAREAFAAVLAVRSDSAAALAGLGETALRQGLAEEAIRFLEDALRVDPRADRLYYPLGMAYRRAGRIDKARASLARVGDTEPVLPDPVLAEMARLTRSPQIFLEQGYAAAKAGRMDEAVASFRQAVALDSDDVSARLSLGQGLLLTGDTADALAEFDRALELDPDHPEAHYRRGTLLEESNDDQAAVGEYRAALAADPDHLQARLRLADALMRLQRYEEAAEAYAAIDAAEESRALVRYKEGLARLAAGECEAAMTALETGLDLKPDSGEIYQALARAYATCTGQGDPRRERAVDLAGQLFRARPDEAHAETLAMAYAGAGRWAEAIDMQQRVVESSRRRQDPFTSWRQVQLQRYRDGAVAASAWPERHDVYLPARLGVGQDAPGDR